MPKKNSINTESIIINQPNNIKINEKKVLETLGNSITKENNKQKKSEHIPTNKKIKQKIE